MDFGDVELLAVGELDFDGPGFADDVQRRGDEAIRCDDEAGAGAVHRAVAPGEGDGDEGGFDASGDVFDGEGRGVGRGEGDDGLGGGGFGGLGAIEEE